MKIIYLIIYWRNDCPSGIETECQICLPAQTLRQNYFHIYAQSRDISLKEIIYLDSPIKISRRRLNQASVLASAEEMTQCIENNGRHLPDIIFKIV